MDIPADISKQPHDSSLLYSEYMNADNAKHVVNLIENKNRKKTVMKFVPSSILMRVQDLLPRLEESEKELKKKPKKDCDIENVDRDTTVIEMDVAVVKEPEDGETERHLKPGDSESTKLDDEKIPNLEILSENDSTPSTSKVSASRYSERKTDLLDVVSSKRIKKSCDIEHLSHNSVQMLMSAKNIDTSLNPLCQVSE